MPLEPLNERPYRLGVGVMLLNDHGEILVAQRIDNPGPAWQMPQGGIDVGEDPLVALHREVREEIGTDNFEILGQLPQWVTYDIPLDLADRLWGGQFRGQKQMWFCARFLGNPGDICLETEHPEFCAWKWVTPDQLVALIVPFKRELYAFLIKTFAAFLK